jgi:glutathione S-transferase
MVSALPQGAPAAHGARSRLLGPPGRGGPRRPGELRQHVGTNEIPVLVPDDDEPVCGEDDILAYLSQFDELPDAAAHREKAREEVPTFAELGSGSSHG